MRSYGTLMPDKISEILSGSHSLDDDEDEFE